jgi:hypothetical protein
VGKKPARKKTGGKRHPKNRGQARATHEGGASAPPAQLAPRPAVGYNLAANKGPSLANLLNKYAPGIGALRDYYRPWLRADVFAGIAVAAYLRSKAGAGHALPPDVDVAARPRQAGTTDTELLPMLAT